MDFSNPDFMSVGKGEFLGRDVPRSRPQGLAGIGVLGEMAGARVTPTISNSVLRTQRKGSGQWREKSFCWYSTATGLPAGMACNCFWISGSGTEK
jgi:hypothetical protein